VFDRTYQEELAFLREMGREIASARPGLCDALAAPGLDPDVERLLEGFAFLAARTRERADDAIPEAIESIAEVVAPFALRPIPASTVIELTPRASLVPERVVIARGASFGARPIDGVRAELRSTTDAEVSPISVARTVLDDAHAGSPALVVSLRAPRTALESLHAKRPLRIFLHGPLPLTSTLACWIDQHLEGVTYRTKAGEHTLGLTAKLVDPDDEPHLPWPDGSPDGARILVESFYFPERHLFVDVSGLDTVPAALRSESAELVLRFRRPPALPERVPEDCVRLHCVPAINLFSCDAEPIAWDDDRADVPLRAAGLPPGASEVFEVESVIGLREGARDRATYRAFSTFTHLGAREGFFALRRASSPLDGGVDTFLRVGGGKRRGRETLSITMRCTNRRLASRLRPGDVSVPTARSPALATFTNLTSVGPSASAPVGRDVLHRLVGLARAGSRSRLSTTALAAYVGLFVVREETDVVRARANAAHVEAIIGVATRREQRARRGLLERSVGIDVSLDEGRFASIGEAFLFGRALDCALAKDLPVNLAQSLTVALAPSGRRIGFRTRSGTGAPF
jgi:type VI secretion system protein ImpG